MNRMGWMWCFCETANLIVYWPIMEKEEGADYEYHYSFVIIFFRRFYLCIGSLVWLRLLHGKQNKAAAAS